MSNNKEEKNMSVRRLTVRRFIFCTCIYNRLWQFKQLFNKNMADLAAANRLLPKNEFHWVVYDSGSTDGLKEYVLGVLGKQNAPSYFHFYSSPPDGNYQFHIPKAKNKALLLGYNLWADFLVTLDCDNYFANWFDILGKTKEWGADGVHNWSQKWLDGSYGRIGFTRSVFQHLRGYDEEMEHAGFHDYGMLHRIELAGYKLYFAPLIGEKPIINTKKDTLGLEGSPLKDEIDEKFSKMNEKNAQIHSQKIRRGDFVANPNGFAWEGREIIKLF